jgi:hypothetical protein
VLRHGFRTKYLLVVVAVIGQWRWLLLVLLGLVVDHACWWCWLMMIFGGRDDSLLWLYW